GQRRPRGADNGVIPAFPPPAGWRRFFLPSPPRGRRGTRWIPRRPPLPRRVRDEPFLLAGRTHPDPGRGLPLLRPEFHGLVPARPDAGADRRGAPARHPAAGADGGGADPVRRRAAAVPR